MNTKERNSLIDLRSLMEKVDLKNEDIKFYITDILGQLKIGLEREKEDLEFRISTINQDLELIEFIKEQKNLK